jgi:hypothetical protein
VPYGASVVPYGASVVPYGTSVVPYGTSALPYAPPRAPPTSAACPVGNAGGAASGPARVPSNGEVSYYCVCRGQFLSLLSQPSQRSEPSLSSSVACATDARFSYREGARLDGRRPVSSTPM